MSNQPNPIIAALVLVRQARGISQQQVATTMGTRQSAVSEWESGVVPNPRWSAIVGYAQAVGVTLGVLVRLPEGVLVGDEPLPQRVYRTPGTGIVDVWLTP